MKTTITRWEIEHDPAATRACYAQIPVGAGCDCATCRNFIAVDSAFPSEFRSLAELLAIDLTKPAEIVHYNREDSGLHFYGGWFHIVGSIISGEDALQNGRILLERLLPNFELGFRRHTVVVDDAFLVYRSDSLIQIEFQTKLPWIIRDAEPE